MNELQAQRKRMAYRVAVYSYSLVNRTIAMRATEGFIKILSTGTSNPSRVAVGC
jgi:dihydrolipoamide dehydrogenase